MTDIEKLHKMFEGFDPAGNAPEAHNIIAKNWDAMDPNERGRVFPNAYGDVANLPWEKVDLLTDSIAIYQATFIEVFGDHKTPFEPPPPKKSIANRLISIFS